ncbi:DUF6682 family protein [Variovorax sp. dw_954]|uniref:phage adaptor protein n=1 Tax=Variovorax sp. dw_954 TaxID=2720078 RepID=UPI001BD530F3|nr:DUF6682 family protein [Variovorax sp. dw_954]
MKASRPINQARILLADLGKVRWADDELLGWLNGAQLQIVAVRPDAKATKATINLVAGADQTIPVTGTRLLDVKRNVGGRAITLISRDQLNEFDPDWYAADQSDTIKHYTFDPNDPKSFEVVPPAIAGTQVSIVYAAIPTDCADLNADIALDDIYEGPLIDWICYRAWIKDGETSPDQQRAANALATFMQALTGKTRSDQATRPARK